MEAADAERTVAKLRRSCESCRASKGRCCPSKEKGTCLKCIKDGKVCVFLGAKPRPRRAKNSRLRVEEMEQKIDSLYALLSNSKTGSPRSVQIEELQIEPESTLARTSQVENLTSYHTAPLHPEVLKATQQFPVFSLPYLSFDDNQDVIQRGIISFREAEESLEIYRAKTSAFPFVVLTTRTSSLDFLRREKPFLLLAILTVAAQSSLKRLGTLEAELRETMSKKVMLNGEKSLDILQGILVYLNWYHLYYDHDRQQIYQLSQIAVTMAIELGINNQTGGTPFMDDFTVFNDKSQTFNSNSFDDDIEAKRTFLGCYYLSSGLCLALRRPNNIKFTDYTEECSQMLAQVGDADLDHLLPFFIRIQRFFEEVGKAFDYSTAINRPQSDSIRIGMLAENFKQQLSQLEITFPVEAWSNPTITTSYHSLKIYINEVGFHAKGSGIDLMSAQISREWYYSSGRNESLLSCLQASKEYLDYFLNLPCQTILDFGLPEVLRLVYAVLILGRFATGCDAPSLDASHIREIANMGYYLDALILKTIPMVMAASITEEGKDFMWYIQKLFQMTRHWYTQFMTSEIDQTTAFVSFSTPELCFMNMLPTMLGVCKDITPYDWTIKNSINPFWRGILPSWAGC